jgi:predicted Zn-dependent peptidase
VQKGIEDAKNIDAVSAADIKRVVETYLVPQRTTSIIGVPKKGSI